MSFDGVRTQILGLVFLSRCNDYTHVSTLCFSLPERARFAHFNGQFFQKILTPPAKSFAVKLQVNDCAFRYISLASL